MVSAFGLIDEIRSALYWRTSDASMAFTVPSLLASPVRTAGVGVGTGDVGVTVGVSAGVGVGSGDVGVTVAVGPPEAAVGVAVGITLVAVGV